MDILQNEKITPLVSIIIPCYNYGSFISQTLDCLLSQSYQNWEAIIVDDGSTDHTLQVVDEYLKKDDRFTYTHQPNQGPSAARNTGLENAKGTYIHFLDADDLLSVDKIAVQVSYMEQHIDCDISYTDAYYFDNNQPDELFKNFSLTKKVKDWMPKISARGRDVLPYLITKNIMPINTALIRKEFLSKNNLFFDGFYQSVEDWHFWLCCAYKNASFTYLDNKSAYVLIRVHPNSLSQNRAKMIDYEIKLRYAIKAYLEQNSEIKYLDKVNNKYLYKLLYRDVLWDSGFISYSGVLHIIKKIGWVDGMKLIFSEFNAVRKEKAFK